LLGRVLQRAVYRIALVRHKERIVERLTAPIGALCGVVLWALALGFLDLPVGVLDACRTAAQIGLLVALAWTAARVVDNSIVVLASRSTWITGHRLSESLLPAIARIVKGSLAAIVVVMALASLGYAVGALVVGLAIAGLAVVLAAHKTLEDVFGAYAIGVDHPFREGDFVRLDNGLAGTVEVIGLRSTRIRISDRSLVTVPNRRLADAQIETISEHDGMPTHSQPTGGLQ
jgi:MscS family membrane protein